MPDAELSILRLNRIAVMLLIHYTLPVPTEDT